MQNKEQMTRFDRNGIAVGKNFFGFPEVSVKNAKIIILCMPWEVTVSSGEGALHGPDRILEGSHQVDLDPYFSPFWEFGVAVVRAPSDLIERGKKLRKYADAHINALHDGQKSNIARLKKINDGCQEMVNWVHSTSDKYLKDGKLVVLLGGDHSTPLGLITAYADRYPGLGILHIDAHFDLRDSYLGFNYAHASIMLNALKLKNVGKLVCVGIRSFCDAEKEIAGSDSRVSVFYDRELKRERFSGKSWDHQVSNIIAQLPEYVYISDDVDGQQPYLCPGTGTPVPGGLTFEEKEYLIECVSRERTIIGFDINETGNSIWDGYVSAEMLYRILGYSLRSKTPKILGTIA